MKIAICSSMVFTEKMLEVQGHLKELGHTAFVSAFVDSYVGKSVEEKEKQTILDKNENDAMREYWEVIKKCDAILILNYTRREIENYIGGNSFLEMGFAHVLNKRIFLMNPIPEIPLYKSEIEAMRPVVINENLSKISM